MTTRTREEINRDLLDLAIELAQVMAQYMSRPPKSVYEPLLERKAELLKEYEETKS